MSPHIGAILEEPFSTPCAFERDCTRRGYGVDVALLVCEFLQLNCTFSFFDSGAYGDVDQQSGNASGMIGAIVSGRYDTSLPVLTPTYRRSSAVSFSSLYFFTSVLFVTRAPAAVKIGRLSFAFTLNVYLIFLACFILSCLLLTFIIRKLNVFDKSESISMIFTDIVLQMIKCEFYWFLTRSTPVRIILVFWSAVSIVIMSAYTSMLCSREIVQGSEVPFVDYESFVDCLSAGKCRIIVPTESSSIPQQLQYPGSAFAERIARALAENPMRVVPNEGDIPRLIMNETRDIFWVWPASKGVFHYLTENNKDCSFYTIDAPFKDLGAFAFRKDDREIMTRIDRAASHMRENGLAEYIEAKYYSNGSALSDYCHEQWNGGMKSDAYIPFSAMMDTFTFYLGGMGVSLGGFVLEWVVRRRSMVRLVFR